jgi:hypothetical protein
VRGNAQTRHKCTRVSAARPPPQLATRGSDAGEAAELRMRVQGAARERRTAQRARTQRKNRKAGAHPSGCCAKTAPKASICSTTSIASAAAPDRIGAPRFCVLPVRFRVQSLAAPRSVPACCARRRCEAACVASGDGAAAARSGGCVSPVCPRPMQSAAARRRARRVRAAAPPRAPAGASALALARSPGTTRGRLRRPKG